MDYLLSDDYFMDMAIKEAQKAFDDDEVPIGAVIVSNGIVLSKGYNQVEKLNDVTAHAEMIAFTAAANKIGGKYLKECVLYVTLQPCTMCLGAAYWSQISKIVYGASDEKRGLLNWKLALHPSTEVVGGIKQKECSELLSDYFRSKR